MPKKEGFECQNWRLTFMKWTPGSFFDTACKKKYVNKKQDCQKTLPCSDLKLTYVVGRGVQFVMYYNVEEVEGLNPASSSFFSCIYATLLS